MSSAIELEALRSRPVPRIDVRAVRRQLNLSQPEFAIKYGFALGTIRKWENGDRYPVGPARLLLAVIAYAPTVVEEALAAQRAVG